MKTSAQKPVQASQEMCVCVMSRDCAEHVAIAEHSDCDEIDKNSKLTN